MKKLLLGTAAVLVGMSFAPEANAQVNLDLSGHFKGYMTWHRQNNTDDAFDYRRFDMLRETEVHFTGETTLDNGLTVGAHVEFNVDLGDGGDDLVEESYIYMSGMWGRVNVGAEDGAAYLLQVAAPSADSNIDGIRQFINPINYDIFDVASVNDYYGGVLGGQMDYAQDITGYSDKITYLSPVFQGFQAGVSYTPRLDTPSRAFGVSTRDVDGEFEHGWDLAARYEGHFDQFGLTLGGGWSRARHEGDDTVAVGLNGADQDDWKAWNLGANVGFQAFNLGAAYTRDNMATAGSHDQRTWVVGADYTTGPFKLGASYMDMKQNFEGEDDIKARRYSGGVTYTYGPGMTFRGSVHHVRHRTETGEADPRATSFLLGTQINF